MNIDDKAIAKANKFRKQLQSETETIDEAESVAILLWLSFVKDHAVVANLELDSLAPAQLGAFLEGIDFILIPTH